MTVVRAAARRELQAGNAPEALRALDAYEKSATQHALAAEAMLLRVRALVSGGRPAEARALVARYTQARPNDAYAKKLTELVGGATP
jgi:outer membrane protein assembly factor BamD (BamD/ComL family)